MPLRRVLRSLRAVRSFTRAVRGGDALAIAAIALDAGAGLTKMLPRPTTDNAGFIYIFSNPGQVGVKCGMTNNVERRRKEMRTTGIAYEFVVEFFCPVLDMRAAERKAHAALAAHRMGTEHETSGTMPEHFMLGPVEAVALVADALDVAPDDYYFRRRGP
jgi:hypothetical protein